MENKKVKVIIDTNVWFNLLTDMCLTKIKQIISNIRLW
jgi:3-deoxy-D-manno-octulosonic-acid transferase